jgi:ABC-type protease/lipase transport system fused ATPase/permease subunit
VNSVETALVIVLSVGMAALLVLSIILVSIMIAVMKNVQKISDRAEEATSNINELVASLGRKVAPVAVSGIVSAIMRRWRSKG